MYLFQLCIKLTHSGHAYRMAAHIRLKITVPLQKMQEGHSVQMLITMPTGHTCVTEIMMETSFHDFSVINQKSLINVTKRDDVDLNRK